MLKHFKSLPYSEQATLILGAFIMAFFGYASLLFGAMFGEI